MTHKALAGQRGPFRVDQLESGDPYELSGGHPVLCLPTGGRGAKANLVGAQVLATDPDVAEAGVDTGYALSADTLRAPDVAVGNVPNRPGWVQGVPPLAVEYADTGQDEAELREKIADLLGAGTRWVWVVRLGLPRRVEVHAPGQPMLTRVAGELLEAPGVLRNPVAVEALYDAEAANAATLRNLLQRAGYDGLDGVRAEGKAEGIDEGRLGGLREAVLGLAEAKGLVLDQGQRQRIDACTDPAQLTGWLRALGTAASGDALAGIIPG
jgi:hypothetical protein